MLPPSRSRAHFLAAVTAMILATATILAAWHIRLVNEGSSGPLYQCGPEVCTRAQTDNPSRTNLSWMGFFVLPQGCVDLARAALRPGGLGIDIECGAPGGTSRYRCEGVACRPLEASEGDEPGARPIALPADCGGRIHEVIVLNAESAAPVTFIECDASSGPVVER